MELILNLAWLLLCAAGVGLWEHRRLSRRGPMRRSQAVHGFVSLGLAAVLIFPVISITDDLQTLMVPEEEPAPSKVAKYTASLVCPVSLKIRHVPIAFGSIGFMIFCRQSFGYVLPALLNTAVSRPFPRLEIRGPPGR